MMRFKTIGGAAWLAGVAGLCLAGAVHAQCEAKEACETPVKQAKGVRAVTASPVRVVRTERATASVTCPPETGVKTEWEFELNDASGLMTMWRILRPVPDGQFDFDGASFELALAPSFEQFEPSRFGADGAQPETRNIIVMTRNDGANTVTVTIKDGKINAEVNGKALPADRVRTSGDHVEIVGEDGNVIAKFITLTPPAAPPAPGAIAMERWSQLSQPGGRARVIGPNVVITEPGQSGVYQLGLSGETPKVMVGITMSEVPESLAEQLHIQPGEAFVIERIIEGLPADKAGLQRADVVVRVEGADKATQENLRAVLKKKNPGDPLKLVVVRRGEKKEIEVRLAPFEAEKLGMVIESPAQGVFEMSPQWNEQMRALELAPQWRESFRGFEQFDGGAVAEGALNHARKAMEEALKHLRASGQHGQGAVDEASKAIEQAIKELNSPAMRRQIEERVRELRGAVTPSEPRAATVVPQPRQPVPPRGEIERQREELDEVRAELREIKTLLRRLIEEREDR